MTAGSTLGSADQASGAGHAIEAAAAEPPNGGAVPVSGLLRRNRTRGKHQPNQLRRLDGDPAADVTDLVHRVSEALEAGGDRLEPGAVFAAREVLARVVQRAELGYGHTVVALAGSTGSGKSSLFNAIAGMEISHVGALRPTTSSPVACVWGQTANALLDWLEIPSRHRTERLTELEAGREQPLQGLVLLDMPDHDSREASHRLDVDRLVDLVDVLVWVVDPQKYADNALHNNYLRRLAGHEDVLVVVLNQVDTILLDAVPAVRDDLRRLLDEDGLPGVDIVLSSARTGLGVDKLRGLLADAVASRAMATARARADLYEAALALRAGVGDDEAVIDEMAAHSQLVAALADAASVRSVLDAIDAHYRHEATAHVGWPPTRWLRRFRPDPLRRIRVGSPDIGPELAALTRSSVPTPTPAQLARVDLAERELIERATTGLPVRWADAVRDAPAATADLRDALDQAVVSTNLRFGDPRWWRVIGALQIVLVVAGVTGALVLTALAGIAYLQLPRVDLPAFLRIPLPTWLLVGGFGGGLLLALVSGRLVPRRARARRLVAETRLLVAVAAVARERVLSPVADVLADHRRCRDLLTR